MRGTLGKKNKTMKRKLGVDGNFGRKEGENMERK
jgi:hypothetical protein